MKRNTPLIIALTLAAVISPIRFWGQNLDYNTFINRVMQHNLDYAAAKLDLSVSQADLSEAKKLYSDPTLSAEYGNNSDWDIAMGQSLSFELGKTISLGKRAARIEVARHNLDASDAGLRLFAFTLRAEASLAYADALLARDLANIGLQNAQNMQSLHLSDSLRHATGELSEIDVMQTHLEANIAKQDYLSLMVDYRNALVQLDLLMGNTSIATQNVSGDLTTPLRSYNLDHLLHYADSLRLDIAQQRHLALASQSELTQIRRDRLPDIDLALGVNYNTRVRNEEAPAPEFVGYTLGVSIPLPFSNLNRSDIRAGQFRAQQANIQTDIVRQQARAEIIKAYNNYRSALDRLSEYKSVILTNARQVLAGKMYAYKRGETSLLEVINAQHTYNELQQSYAECMHECMTAWIELERSAGTGNITFE